MGAPRMLVGPPGPPPVCRWMSLGCCRHADDGRDNRCDYTHPRRATPHVPPPAETPHTYTPPHADSHCMHIPPPPPHTNTLHICTHPPSTAPQMPTTHARIYHPSTQAPKHHPQTPATETHQHTIPQHTFRNYACYTQERFYICRRHNAQHSDSPTLQKHTGCM